MSVPFGKSIFGNLASFVAKGWFTVSIPRLRDAIISAGQKKNEVRAGGVVTIGASVTASVVQITTTALDATLNGKLKTQLAAQTNQDIFTTAGVFAKAIYTDGTDASGISLATDEEVYFAIIGMNADGSTHGLDDADNGVVKLCAIVNGTSVTRGTKTVPPTSAEIQAALVASGIHDLCSGWVWLASVHWDENSASPTAVRTLNRNNAVSAL